MSTLPSVQWLKPAEVADHFRVNRKTVYRWIEDKRLPSYDVGGAKRILRNDVLSFAVPTVQTPTLAEINQAKDNFDAPILPTRQAGGDQ